MVERQGDRNNFYSALQLKAPVQVQRHLIGGLGDCEGQEGFKTTAKIKFRTTTASVVGGQEVWGRAAGCGWGNKGNRHESITWSSFGVGTAPYCIELVLASMFNVPVRLIQVITSPLGSIGPWSICECCLLALPHGAVAEGRASSRAMEREELHKATSKVKAPFCPFNRGKSSKAPACSGSMFFI